METTEAAATINGRIELLIRHLARGRQKDFADKIDVIPGSLANITGSRQSRPGSEVLEKIIAAYPQVNADWLLTGQGAMLREAAGRAADGGEFGREVVERIAAENQYLRNLVQELSQTNRNLSDTLGKPSAGDSRLRGAGRKAACAVA